MADAKPWTFTQLAGAKKELVLSGYDAPFGRPRQQAVVRKGLRVRQRTVRYPGNDGPPTRHVFGDDWLPWELRGRFRDAYGGKGHALARVAELTAFVQDKQQVAIRWGDILAVEGFLEAFDPGIESEGEVEWTLRVLVDQDASAPRKPPTRPDDSAAKLNAVLAILTATIPKLTSSLDLHPNFLDAIAGLVSSINSAIGSVVAAANAVANLEKATFGEIARLRAGIHQLRTAVITLQNAYSAASEDALVLRRSPLGDINALTARSASDVDLTRAAANLADVDRNAAIAQRGKVAGKITARTGDTWDLLAARAVGDAAKAQALRDANGARTGDAPVPGRTYLVPTA